MNSAPGRSTATAPVMSLEDADYVIAAAARAPSVHNTQPWQFRASGQAVELLADPGRMLRRIDPDGREMLISCGAALFGVRLALRRLGYLSAEELFPDPAQRWLLARVRLCGSAPATREETELITALPHRHTHRGPFSPSDVSGRLLAALCADAETEGAELAEITDPKLVAGLSAVVDRAAADQRADPRIAAELRRWVQPTGSFARDGIPSRARVGDTAPAAGQAASGASSQLASGAAAPAQPRFAQRDFGEPGAEEAGGSAPAATAVLSTAADTPADWLRAGQALNRLLLRAATRWVFASLQSQPLESPAHRGEVRDLLGLAGYPQLLLQFGRANVAAATPRRPPAELRPGCEYFGAGEDQR